MSYNKLIQTTKVPINVIINVVKKLWAIPIVRMIATAGLEYVVKKTVSWFEKMMNRQKQKKQKKE